jgi:hypothetical protein
VRLELRIRDFEISEAACWVVPNGRYNAESTVRGGAAPGMSSRGVFDMAGNMREWTADMREPGSRYILGGGISDPVYLFNQVFSQPEFDRSASNGIQLVKRMAESTDRVRAEAPIPVTGRDVVRAVPVHEATLCGYLELYDYDRTPLNALVTARDSSPTDWIREDVSFDLPEGTGRMSAAHITGACSSGVDGPSCLLSTSTPKEEARPSAATCRRPRSNITIRCVAGRGPGAAGRSGGGCAGLIDRKGRSAVPQSGGCQDRRAVPLAYAHQR